ncbi:hypothetical protein D9613_007626 [Agrocybe pediades]|uniref:Uncharacterized protein n=1 Tax=Agrocybe pediades TaxID=84607 RepID=A0A8H4QMK3_9AGAR|nr:hypothetical protein D9613_007626 [Agrocybe pediades]KAF9565378.1 hypothetical protein CPC08DRAFT_187652 [Agrocybe pediades]
MSFVSRAVRATKNSIGTRAFHSPFAVLGTSPLTTPNTTKDISAQYEKQYDHPAEPLTSPNTGYRTYVVSEPDPANNRYKVPAGAYPTSSPYVNFTPTSAPDVVGAQYSSTSADLLAHGFTTRAARHHTGGVGESSTLRYKSAPGEMGAKGGGYGGAGLVDEAGSEEGVGTLADRNPPPDGEAAEKFSKAGVDGAWKLRK